VLIPVRRSVVSRLIALVKPRPRGIRRRIVLAEREVPLVMHGYREGGRYARLPSRPRASKLTMYFHVNSV
jgi:hypothetical protein